jgi:hypothetical protein
LNISRSSRLVKSAFQPTGRTLCARTTAASRALLTSVNRLQAERRRLSRGYRSGLVEFGHRVQVACPSRRSSRPSPPFAPFGDAPGNPPGPCPRGREPRPAAEALCHFPDPAPSAPSDARRRLTPQARRDSPPRLTSNHNGPPSHGPPQSFTGNTP